MNEIKIYKNTKQVLKLVGGSAIFVALGLFLVLKSDKSGAISAGWANLAFFGMGLLVGLYTLFDKRPHIVLNDIGIKIRGLKETVNWEVIQDAYPGMISGQEMIALVLHPDYQPSKNKGFIGKKLAKLNKQIGFQEINIPTSNVNVNTIELLTFILLMIKAEKNERKQLITQNTL